MSTKLDNARRTAAYLGITLANVRELRGMSMGQVARKTGGGVDASAVSRIENGSRANPSVATIILLAVAYDCDITFKRDGTIKVAGTKLTQLAEERRRALLPAEGSK